MLAQNDTPVRLTNGSGSDRSIDATQRRHTIFRHRHMFYDVEKSKSEPCLKRATQILFSHIGLVGLVTIYAVAGGFLFQLLEQRQGILNCQEAYGEQIAAVTQLRQKIIDYIQTNTSHVASVYTSVKDNDAVALAKISSMLYEYRQFIIDSSWKYPYYTTGCHEIETNHWTFPNSLLFAITVITTIGYGNITPKTWQGQLCCLCYATIGIPIFLLCLANLSGILGEMFRFVYAKVLCAPVSYAKKRRRMRHVNKHQGEDIDISMDGIVSSNFNVNRESNKSAIKQSSNNVPAEDDFNDKDKYGHQRINVPLTVTMIIIAAYIWAGAALFRTFEGWTSMQSGYFCFITLATIGFGDFVPGQRQDDPNAGAKLILAAVYALFGMAILAMCFDLMQEEIVAKFHWIGVKIGIIENYEEYPDRVPKANNNNSSLKRLSTPLSNISSITTVNTSRTVLENENRNNSLKQRNSPMPRKASPRMNKARVHPVDSEEIDTLSLYQRVPSSKLE